MTKRTFDLVFSLLALVFLAPLFVAIAIAVRVNLGSPVPFIQVRPGLNGKPFRLYKFRTMLNFGHNDGDGLSDSSRTQPFGRFLRSTSLDELPGLWNVVRGDMSLVGPRPLLSEYVALYSSYEARRLEVRPGITGWAQVNGRNGLSWEKKFRFDVWYVDNQSLYLDMKILLLTVRKVFLREGFNSPGLDSVLRFTRSQSDQDKPL